MYKGNHSSFYICARATADKSAPYNILYLQIERFVNSKYFVLPDLLSASVTEKSRIIHALNLSGTRTFELERQNSMKN